MIRRLHFPLSALLALSRSRQWLVLSVSLFPLDFLAAAIAYHYSMKTQTKSPQ